MGVTVSFGRRSPPLQCRNIQGVNSKVSGTCLFRVDHAERLGPPVRKPRSTPRIHHDRVSRHAEWSGRLTFNRSCPAAQPRGISIVELKSRLSAVWWSVRSPCPSATFPPDVPGRGPNEAEAANRRLSGVCNAGPSRPRVPGQSQADPLEHPPVRDRAPARCRHPHRRLLGPGASQRMNISRHFLLILTP